MTNNKISSTLTQMQKEIDTVKEFNINNVNDWKNVLIPANKLFNNKTNTQSYQMLLEAKKEAYLACLSDVKDVIEKWESNILDHPFTETHVTDVKEHFIAEFFKKDVAELKEQLEVKS